MTRRSLRTGLAAMALGIATALSMAGPAAADATDDYPIRYRAESFPNAAELEQLRAVATLAKPVKAG